MEAPGPQRKRKRKHSGARLPKRKRASRHQILASERNQTSSEEDVGLDNDASSPDHTEQDERRVERRSSQRRVRHRGHDYRDISAQGSARLQVGNTYIEHQHMATTSKDTAEREREKFVTDLGFSLMESRLATIGAAHAETCRWLFDNKDYVRWRDPRSRPYHHGFIWIKGKPGAGKSTLMKHAFQHMQNNNHDDSTLISHFFNARGHDLEKTTEGMYRSLLHQIFTHSPQRLPSPIPRYPVEWNANGWPLPILQDWIRKATLGFGASRKFIFYIDALDECDEASIRLAIGFFEELGDLAHFRGINVSVCFASRHYPRITIKHHEIIDLDKEFAHQNDIATFVQRKLRGERDLGRELGDEISRRCSGVFLWAVLVVQIVNEKTDRGATRLQLLAELSTVPSGVEELLKTLVRCQDPDSDSAVLATLQWVLFSRRPLDIPELYFAIKTSMGHGMPDSLDAESTTDEQMRAFILTMSRGLVEFTFPNNRFRESVFPLHDPAPASRATSKVQFIHETVREYFLSRGLEVLDSGLSGHVEAMSHARLGQWCRDYIEIITSLHPRLSLFEMHSFKNYSIAYMLIHMEYGYSGGALDLLSIDAIPHKTWDLLMRDDKSGVIANPKRVHDLLMSDDKSESTILNPSGSTSLYVLIRSNCTELAVAVLKRQLNCSPLTHIQGQTTLPTNFQMSSIPFVDVNTTYDDMIQNTVLSAAIHLSAQTADYRIIELLFSCGADANLASESCITPLEKALEYADSDLVKLLLQHGADPNIAMETPSRMMSLNDRRYPSTMYPLTIAVRRDDQELVEVLLKYGADVRAQAPLCIAAACSSLSTVKLLLAAGADVHDRNESGRTALHEIVLRKEKRLLGLREDVAIALLNAGARINANDGLEKTGPGETALTLAFERKRIGLAKLFLNRGADMRLTRHKEISRELKNFEGDYSVVEAADSASSDDDLIANAPSLSLGSRRYVLSSQNPESVSHGAVNALAAELWTTSLPSADELMDVQSWAATYIPPDKWLESIDLDA
jgi:ankyrin repeat protein